MNRPSMYKYIEVESHSISKPRSVCTIQCGNLAQIAPIFRFKYLFPVVKLIHIFVYYIDKKIKIVWNIPINNNTLYN